jgi:hypothetical protein
MKLLLALTARRQEAKLLPDPTVRRHVLTVLHLIALLLLLHQDLPALEAAILPVVAEAKNKK